MSIVVNGELLLTTKEAGDLLGVSQRRILNLIKAKRIEVLQPGTHYLITETALENVKIGRNGRPQLKSRPTYFPERDVRAARKKLMETGAAAIGDYKLELLKNGSVLYRHPHAQPEIVRSFIKFLEATKERSKQWRTE